MCEAHFCSLSCLVPIFFLHFELFARKPQLHKPTQHQSVVMAVVKNENQVSCSVNISAVGLDSNKPSVFKMWNWEMWLQQERSVESIKSIGHR